MNKNFFKPFFPHDYSPLEDKNLLKLFISLGVEGYGIYWLIVEFMHQNNFYVGEEDLLAYKFHTKVEKIKHIMNDFNLFRIEDDCYVSDRILRNLNYAEQKSKKMSEMSNVRWLLSAFNKYYIEFFDETPILEPKEIEVLKKYNAKIPDFKDKLRDILYTLKNLKFDTDTEFKPCANWLLKDNHLARLLNGEFGKLKHKETPKEAKQKEKEYEEQLKKKQEPNELELKLEEISNKEEALNFIKDFYKEKPLCVRRGKAYLLPTLRILTDKFQIQDEEIIKTIERAK